MDMKQKIINMINSSDEKAVTVNRVYGRLFGVHKSRVKEAIKSLISERKIVQRIATGEAACMLQVPNGTEVYILNK
tara:strand:+ start:1347 stop:1574 length:228 start_codon:yes stop_codon:yes gene_type:complete